VCLCRIDQRILRRSVFVPLLRTVYCRLARLPGATASLSLADFVVLIRTFSAVRCGFRFAGAWFSWWLSPKEGLRVQVPSLPPTFHGFAQGSGWRSRTPNWFEGAKLICRRANTVEVG
jgi:hypothetical protein